jgi:hypothetical protein
VRLLLFHPEVAHRSCADCKKYLHDDRGEFFGDIVRRPLKIGLPLLRPPGTPTPCFICPKIPDDAPERSATYATDMTERNRQVYRHYQECRAVLRFPDDPLVRRHAAIIRGIEDVYYHLRMLGKLDVIAQALGVKNRTR